MEPLLEKVASVRAEYYLERLRLDRLRAQEAHAHDVVHDGSWPDGEPHFRPAEKRPKLEEDQEEHLDYEFRDEPGIVHPKKIRLKCAICLETMELVPRHNLTEAQRDAVNEWSSIYDVAIPQKRRASPCA